MKLKFVLFMVTTSALLLEAKAVGFQDDHYEWSGNDLLTHQAEVLITD